MAVRGLTRHLMFTEDCAKIKLKETRWRLGSAWGGGVVEGGEGRSIEIITTDSLSIGAELQRV